MSAHGGIRGTHCSIRSKPTRLAQLHKRPGKAALQIQVAAAEFQSKFRCERTVSRERSQPHRRAPGSAGDLVVRVVQMLSRDERPGSLVSEFRQGVERLRTSLRRRRREFSENAGEYDITRQPRQSPGQHVAHVEVGLDRATRNQRLQERGIRMRAGAEGGLQTLGGIRMLQGDGERPGSPS